MALPKSSDVIYRRFHVFDMDGTILDSFPVVASIFGDVMAQEGVPAKVASDFLYANTHERVKVLIPQLCAAHGLPVNTMRSAELYDDFQTRFDASEAEFFPRAIKSLRALRPCAKGLFLSSLSPDKLVERRLASGGIDDGLFDLQLGSTKTMKGTAHVQRFAKMVGTKPGDFAKHAVLWGDTAFDMEMAQENRMYAIGVIGTLTGEQLLAAGADEVTSSVSARLSILFTG
jgi:phosphoglycolate phosphatase-like HAD superfamily hydrolase